MPGFYVRCLVGLCLGLLALPLWAFDLAWSDERSLQTLDVGESFTVAQFPLGGDRLGAVRFERIAHYAPGAQVWVVDETGRHALDRSAQRFLVGHSVSGAARLALMHDAESGRWLGSVYGEGGLQTLRGYPGEHGIRFLALAPETLMPDGVSIDSSCALDHFPELQVSEGPAELGLAPATRGAALRLGVLALDTDKEWLDRRFSNNTSAATLWFEQLMLATNLIFERDLNLRMQLGETVLRVGNDPYTVGGSSVTQARLEEFGSYWFNNFASVDRTHAALVSGRSTSGTSAAGIAWLNSYCRTQTSGGSYSLSQLFWSDGVPLEPSARLFAHEIGHNLGSPHTHCYNPPIDHCFNAEPGCYDGPVSCPAGGRGTLMSYCNFGAPSGAGCGQVLSELAPRAADLIDARIVANTPACMVTEDIGIIFQDRFAE